MAQYDFDKHEYQPIMDGEQRAKRRKLLGIHVEWYVREIDTPQRYEVRLCSHTHDDDVELILTGNFTDEQKLRVANEVVAQLNRCEKEFEDEVQHTNPGDVHGTDVLG